MSISDKMALFTLGHTEDPEVAAACAAQLGWRMTKVTPKVNFPPKWVLTQKRPAVETAFCVTYCNDPITLGTIAKRDKRKLVREALMQNPALPEATREELGAKVLSLKSASMVIAGDPDERLEALMSASVAKRYHNYACVDEMVSLLNDNANTLTDGPDRVVAFLAEHDFMAEVLEYLLVSYGQGSSEDVRFLVWDRTTLEPTEVLAKLPLRSLKWVLTNFLNRVTGYKAFASHIDLALTKMMVQSVRPPLKALEAKKGRRMIFSPESVDLLVENYKWYTVLAAQPMTETQFSRLLANTPEKKRGELACVLHAKRDRLAQLATAAGESCYFIQGELEPVLECVTDPEDELLDWITLRCDPYAIANYLLGGWYGGVGKDRVELWPSPARVETVAPYLDRTMMVTLAQYLTNKNNDPIPATPLVEAMVEYIPGLAYITTDSAVAGGYTYSRLTGCGVPLEAALEQFESQARTTTLEKLCRTLSTLAREGQTC